jgi:deazaflavin-dependent oxidoreductase (nitroreductase family)
MYYGVLHHTGRRSGAAYHTPVVAKATERGIVIPLPYGEDTDWCRNVLAAGTCSLTLNGEEYALHSPEVVPARVAEPLLPPANMQVWRRVGIQSYMLLQMRLLAAAPITEAARTPAAV